MLTAQDVSDSGFSPNTDNAGQPDDNGTTEDATLVDFPLFDIGDDGTTSGNPPTLIGVPPLIVRNIGNFLGAPGPIYSGIATNDSNPVTLENNGPITGGYSLDAAGVGGSIQEADCCAEIVDAIPGQPVEIYSEDMLPINMIQGDMIQGDMTEGDCGCGEVIQPAQVEMQPCGECQAPMDQCGCECGPQAQAQGDDFVPVPMQHIKTPSFLQRMKNFLGR